MTDDFSRFQSPLTVETPPPPIPLFEDFGLSYGMLNTIGALVVLGVNVTLMILTGTITLFLQRRFAPHRRGAPLT